jgi:chromosome segregation ATPase
MSGDRVVKMEEKIASLKQRRNEIGQEMQKERQNDQSHKDRMKNLGPQMNELRKKQNAILMANAEYKEARKRDETLRREMQEFRKKAEEELKKTPAYSTLLENIQTLQKAAGAMKQGSAEREKEQKRLNDMHGQRNRMVQDRQSQYPEAETIRKEQFGRRGEVEQLQRAIQKTSEWKEVNREYKKLEKQVRYQPDPRFAREQKQLAGQARKMEKELKLLHVSAAAEANPLEAQLIQSLGFPEWSYHGAIASKVLPGMLPSAPDDVAQLNKAKMLQSRPWPSTVDWDGRAEYEKNKDVIAQPIMQHYLKRMKPWMYK